LAAHVARKEGMKNAQKIIIGKPDGKRSFGRHCSRCEDNIRMELTEIMWDGTGRMHLALAQDRDQWAFVNTALNLRVT